jgi:hypothetical protein
MMKNKLPAEMPKLPAELTDRIFIESTGLSERKFMEILKTVKVIQN